MDLPELPESVLWWVTGLSVGTLVATLVGVPWVVARLPPDYFSRPRREPWHLGVKQPLLELLVAIGKNALGAVLVLAGLVMLLTPGQGVLTVLVGLLLINFPGKYRLERWLVRRPGVLRALNWLRRRRGQTPFEAPPPPGAVEKR